MSSCSVCGRAFRGGEEGSVTRCGHIFHADCLRSFLSRLNQCPECNANITQEDICSLYFDSTSSRGTNPSRNERSRNQNHNTQNEIERMLEEMRVNNTTALSTLPDLYVADNYGQRSNNALAERNAGMVNHGVIINCNEYSPVVVNIDVDIPWELLLALFI